MSATIRSSQRTEQGHQCSILISTGTGLSDNLHDGASETHKTFIAGASTLCRTVNCRNIRFHQRLQAILMLSQRNAHGVNKI